MPHKMTTSDFLNKAQHVHGTTYDYSLVNYVNTNTPVQIICNQHGIFNQLPRIHLKGCNCPKCTREEQSARQTMTTEEFIEKALAVHSALYDYQHVKYINNETKVHITCNVCTHHFFMRPAMHLYGQGCSVCALSRIAASRSLTQSEFISRLQARYGDNLLYHKVRFVRLADEVCLVCAIHGDFTQRGDYLLDNKIACPTCVLISKQLTVHRPGGYSSRKKLKDPNKRAHIYALELKDGAELFYKVGVTIQSINRRFPRLKVAGYDIKVINDVETTLAEAILLEQQTLKSYSAFKYTPTRKFNGHTECLSVYPNFEGL